MRFLWPEMLWLLLLIVPLVGAYVVALRRRKRTALRYASLLLVRDSIGTGQRLRRHVPPALLALALLSGILALARPTASVVLPAQYMTIAMAMDVSLSMRATDVEPNRLIAAQNAAKAFIEELPAQCTPRYRFVRRHRGRRSDADREQARHAGRDRSLSAAAGHRDRQRTDPRARHAVPG